MNLKDKIALVSGASRGIGKAIALELGKEGATIVGTATTPQGASDISAYLEKNNISGRGMIMNVRDQESINSVINTVKVEVGVINILVNNAAITRDNLMLRMKDEEWDDIINTNLNSVYRVTKACLKDMLKARWGRIISVSSVVGLTGNAGQANYAAAKAGVIGFTKSLAQEIASRDITVNVVAPGFIDTDMTRGLAEEHKQTLLSKIPAGRLGLADEIAYAVKFLALPAAAYITGHTLHINGGMYMN